MTKRDSARDSGRQTLRRALPTLELLALASFAFGQPILDILRRQSEFFVARDLGSTEIIALPILLLFVAPLPFLLIDRAALLAGMTARTWTRRLLVGLLSGLVVLPLLKRVPGLDHAQPAAALATLMLASLAGVSAAWIFERTRPGRAFLALLCFSPFVFGLLFLLDPGVFGLLRPPADQQPAQAATGATTPIVFVVLDELAMSGLLTADGEINPHRYPHLSALAEGATWFENASTVSNSTVWAVPALLTGAFPDPKRPATAAAHPTNLFTFFADYEVRADEYHTQLCPPDINRLDRPPSSLARRLRLLASDLLVVYAHVIAPRFWEARLPSVTESWQGFLPTADDDPAHQGSARTGDALAEASDRFRRFLDALDSRADRHLYYIHLQIPHTPWIYLPSGKEYRRDRSGKIPGLTASGWSEDPWATTQAYQRYLLQLQFTDRLIGDLVARMKGLGFYNRSLLVITSDHGISIRPGEQARRLTETNPPEILPTLVLVKKPYQEVGERVSTTISAIDLFPTLLDVLGIPPPPGIDGHSAVAPGYQGASTRQVFFRGERLVRAKRGAGRGRWALYEHEKDLHERKHDLVPWKLRTFGDGSDPRSLFAVGTHADLHGRSEVELRIKPDSRSPVVALVDDLALLKSLDPTSSLSLSRIGGRLQRTDRAAECRDLAIAVNGRIEATTRTVARGNDCEWFSAMVPESALRPGANRVAIYLIDGSGEDRLLRPTRDNAPSTALLVGAADKIEAVELEGIRLPVEQGRFRGRLNSFEDRGLELRFGGWAVDVKRPARSTTVLLFGGDRMLDRASTDEPRERVARRFANPSIRPGFSFHIRKEAIAGLTPRELRIVAVSTDEAVVEELPIRASASARMKSTLRIRAARGAGPRRERSSGRRASLKGAHPPV